MYFIKIKNFVIIKCYIENHKEDIQKLRYNKIARFKVYKINVYL